MTDKLLNVIYQPKGHWETDWLTELLSGFKINFVYDSDMNVYLDNSLIITNTKRESALNKYFKIFNNKGFKYGVIQLSDESYKLPHRFYTNVPFIYRNYYKKSYSNLANLKFFPLGYKEGFWNNKERYIFKQANERKYLWNFIGQVNGKPTRLDMLVNALRVPHGFIYTTGTWRDTKSIEVTKYRDILSDSIYTLAPSGWCNPDSFRLCEALEVGSIPILEYSNGYFNNLFETNHPLPTVKNWKQIKGLINELEPSVTKLQQTCVNWWNKVKNDLKEDLKNSINNHIFK